MSGTKMIQLFDYSHCFLCEPLRLFGSHFNVTSHAEYFPAQALSGFGGIRSYSLPQNKIKKRDSIVLLLCFYVRSSSITFIFFFVLEMMPWDLDHGLPLVLP